MAAADLVPAYWRHYALSTSDVRSERLEARSFEWAWEAVEAEVAQPGPRFVDLLVQLAEAVEGDERALGYLGPGPLESLISHYGPRHVLPVLSDLVVACRRSVPLRQALQTVVLADYLDPVVAEQIGPLQR